MKQNNDFSEKFSIAASQNIKEKQYWLKQLAGNPEKSYFPYDYVANLEGAVVDVVESRFPSSENGPERDNSRRRVRRRGASRQAAGAPLSG